MKKQKKISNDVEDRDIFIRIDPASSLETKKDLLEITESLIETQIAAEKFKQQRRDEMKVRLDAKKTAKEMSSALSKMLSELPKEIKIKVKEEKEAPAPRAVKIEKPKVEIIKKEAKEEVRPTKMSDLQRELEDIKSRLAGLR